MIEWIAAMYSSTVITHENAKVQNNPKWSFLGTVKTLVIAILIRFLTENFLVSFV